MSLPFKVVAKIPDVEIKQTSFDFGKLTTLGTSGTLPLTLVNKSSLNSVLILDLRDHGKNSGIDCMDIEFLGSNSERYPLYLGVLSPLKRLMSCPPTKVLSRTNKTPTNRNKKNRSKNNPYLKMKITKRNKWISLGCSKSTYQRIPNCISGFPLSLK